MNTKHCDEYCMLREDLQTIKLKLEDIQQTINKIDKKQEKVSSDLWGKNGFNQRLTKVESTLRTNLGWTKLALTSIISIVIGIIIGVFV